MLHSLSLLGTSSECSEIYFAPKVDEEISDLRCGTFMLTRTNTAIWRHVSLLVMARDLLSYDSVGLSHIPKPFLCFLFRCIPKYLQIKLPDFPSFSMLSNCIKNPKTS
jgi:hypothetical protein